MKRSGWLLHVSLSLMVSPLGAEVLTREDIDGFLNKLGADNHFDARKGVNWSVLPGPFYTPELKLGLGTAVAGIYQVDPDDHLTQNSSISFTGFVSASGALGLGFTNYTFFSDDQWRLFVDGSLAKIPTGFWGIGYDAAQGDEMKYTEHSLRLHPQIFYRLADNLYGGAGWDFSILHADADDAHQDDVFTRYGADTQSLSSGATVAVNYDTRDVITRPQHGQFYSAQYSIFDPATGSDTHFNALQLQANHYQPLTDSEVLAFDVWGRFSQGDVPWDRLSMAGDDRRLRGYYQGQYRDKDVVSAQVEYRKKLNWRHGYVLWLGAGALGDKPGDLTSHPLLPNAGAGYRFEVKPDMNIRLDLGFGRESAGFYFQIAEAF